MMKFVSLCNVDAIYMQSKLICTSHPKKVILLSSYFSLILASKVILSHPQCQNLDRYVKHVAFVIYICATFGVPCYAQLKYHACFWIC